MIALSVALVVCAVLGFIGWRDWLRAYGPPAQTMLNPESVLAGLAEVDALKERIARLEVANSFRRPREKV